MSTSDSSQWFSWLPVPDDVQARADKKGLGHSAVEIERRKQNRRAIARVSEKLDRLYASGVPFFTKYALRDIAEQVERLPIHTGDPRETRVHTFVLQGLDGNPVEVTVTLGTTRPGQSPETYWLDNKLEVGFETIDQLTSLDVFHADTFDPKRAFLPMRMMTLMKELRRDTNEPCFDLVPSSVMPFEEIDALFGQQKAKWQASAQCQQLISTLDSVPIEPVKNIVAFACGHLWYRDSEWERSAVQHASILVLQEYVAARQNVPREEIKCFAQEPNYQEVDKRFLAHIGITVLQNPRAFLEVDETTIVISIHPNPPIRQIVADIARPAMMIWDTVQRDSHDSFLESEHYGVTVDLDNISPRVEHMINTQYQELPFPEDNENFSKKVALYVRKQDVLELDVHGAPILPLLELVKKQEEGTGDLV